MERAHDRNLISRSETGHSKRGSTVQPYHPHILQANSKSNLVIRFGPAGTELGLLWYLDGTHPLLTV
jgi:hypothetical protein